MLIYNITFFSSMTYNFIMSWNPSRHLLFNFNNFLKSDDLNFRSLIWVIFITSTVLPFLEFIQLWWEMFSDHILNSVMFTNTCKFFSAGGGGGEGSMRDFVCL